MARLHQDFVLTDSDSSDDVRIHAGRGKYAASHRSKRSHRESSPPPVFVENNFLGVPKGRQRASSTGGSPQPNYIQVVVPSRSPSRDRSRHHHSGDSDDSYGSRGRRRSSYRESVSMETAQALAELKIRKEERAQEAAIAEYKERERKQKEREKAIVREAEDRRREEEQEEKDRRKRILLEEEDRKKKKKEEDEELRKRILREEDERKEKEKRKKKEEEEEFRQKVRERFTRAGYTPDYIDAILEKEERQKNRVNRDTAIDLSRPTYIRVQRKHLFPDTLDHYGLPWEYDSSDSRYIIIKKYIDHDFQQVLFRHTESIRINKEPRLLTDGYTKETITTLKPGIQKDDDQMYLVRRKSTSKQGRSRSRSVNRSSWMFT